MNLARPINRLVWATAALAQLPSCPGRPLGAENITPAELIEVVNQLLQRLEQEPAFGS